MLSRQIAHLDSDCFYVSAERVRNKALLGCPVGVLGNNGACVIAKSYELREYGIKTGEPVWEAKAKCPCAIFIKRDFRWYEAVSRKLLALLKTVSPAVEYYSIDEMFFDAGELAKVSGTDLETAAHQLQQRVLKEVGIPVSLGIGPTKILAKLGSDSSKPFGVKVLTGDLTEFLSHLPISEVCGIGGRSAAKLAGYGIHTCQDFIQARGPWINKLLTVVGERLWWELKGDSVLPIVTTRPQHQFVARGGSVGRSITTLEGVRAWTMRSLERLIETLNSHQYVCSTLACEMEYKGRLRPYYWAGRLRLPMDTADFEQLQPTALALLDRGWEPGGTLTHLHLLAGGIKHRGRKQLSLFDQPKPQVDQLKQRVNEKLGRFTLRSAATLLLPELYQDGSHDYEICDVAGKMCF